MPSLNAGCSRSAPYTLPLKCPPLCLQSGALGEGRDRGSGVWYPDAWGSWVFCFFFLWIAETMVQKLKALNAQLFTFPVPHRAPEVVCPEVGMR